MKNGKYQKQDIVALRKSIKHWKKDNVGKKDPDDLNIGAMACALCKLYDDVPCSRCPIGDKRGNPGCANTPHDLVGDLLADWEETGKKPKHLEQAVAAEIAFLEGLLKEAEAQFKKAEK